MKYKKNFFNRKKYWSYLKQENRLVGLFEPKWGLILKTNMTSLFGQNIR